MGKEFVLKAEKDEWSNVLDEKTGLVGWVKKDQLSPDKPTETFKGKDYDQSFKIFKEFSSLVFKHTGYTLNRPAALFFIIVCSNEPSL